MRVWVEGMGLFSQEACLRVLWYFKYESSFRRSSGNTIMIVGSIKTPENGLLGTIETRKTLGISLKSAIATYQGLVLANCMPYRIGTRYNLRNISVRMYHSPDINASAAQPDNLVGDAGETRKISLNDLKKEKIVSADTEAKSEHKKPFLYFINGVSIILLGLCLGKLYTLKGVRTASREAFAYSPSRYTTINWFFSQNECFIICYWNFFLFYSLISYFM